MIISKSVEVKLGHKNFTFLKKKYNLDNNLGSGDIVNIPIEMLSKGSKSIVIVSCDYCEKILSIPYKRYILSTTVINKYACSSKNCSNQKIRAVCRAKYGVENPFQSEIIKEKSKDTLKRRYGVEHPMHLKETKDKIKKTCKKKYGVDNYMKTEECRQKIKKTSLEKYGVDHPTKSTNEQEKRKITRINRGLQIPDNLVSDYRKYRLSVNRPSNRIKNKILEKWDGYDYYDGEYIKDNFFLNKNDRCYPHFDHKISAFYGFCNDIDASVIGSIDNICITKQWINGLKGEMCESDFIKIFKK